MAKIACLYNKKYKKPVEPCTMDTIRWLRVAEAFSRFGHDVDIIINGDKDYQLARNLRYVSAKNVRWEQYDVVKTSFHSGFEFLMECKGDDHPFIISKLGSVVGHHNDVEGVYFFDERREYLYNIQKHIAKKSKYVSILTQESVDLWVQEHGGEEKVLYVPTGVDLEAKLPVNNPYKDYDEKIVVYIGNLYNEESGQRAVNLLWQDSLNRIGRRLKKRGIRLVVIGPGLTDKLEEDNVTVLGPIDNKEIYDYMYFADVGLVLAQGDIQHNESSKIYEYIRMGLPVVSEEPVPNNHIIREANLGFEAPFKDDKAIADLIELAIYSPWDKSKAIDFMLKNHTWDKRVQTYHQMIESEMLCALQK